MESTRIGGGFGRRLLSDYAAEAAVVSRAIGSPVQIVDTRTGDLQHDYYRPMSVQRLRAGLDAQGRLLAWDHSIVSASRNAYRRDPRPAYSTEMYGSYIGRAATVEQLNPDLLPTRIPKVRVRYGRLRTGVPTGAWRVPSHVVNAFTIETTLDELAALAKRSLVDLRLDFLGEASDVWRSHERQALFSGAAPGESSVTGTDQGRRRLVSSFPSRACRTTRGIARTDPSRSSDARCHVPDRDRSPARSAPRGVGAPDTTVPS